MPLYDYQCSKCGHTEERFFKMADVPDEIPCECGAMAEKCCGSAILRDEPTWLESSRMVLQPDGEKPIESRSEYRRYLKEHGIAERG